MRLTNQWKKENSRIILADGITDLGEGSMSFRQLNGLMTNMLSHLHASRRIHVQSGGSNEPFASMTQECLQELLDRLAKSLRNQNSDSDDELENFQG